MEQPPDSKDLKSLIVRHTGKKWEETRKEGEGSEREEGEEGETETDELGER